jgi:hypothetical protein
MRIRVAEAHALVCRWGARAHRLDLTAGNHLCGLRGNPRFAGDGPTDRFERGLEMRRQGRTAVVILTGLLMAVAATASWGAPALGVEIGEPTVKVVLGADDEGDVTISLSVHVKNITERVLAVRLIIQGLDREGAELFDVTLDDALNRGEERVFTDTAYVKEQVFKSITGWRIEEATIRSGQANIGAQAPASAVAPPAEQAPRQPVGG